MSKTLFISVILIFFVLFITTKEDEVTINSTTTELGEKYQSDDEEMDITTEKEEVVTIISTTKEVNEIDVLEEMDISTKADETTTIISTTIAVEEIDENDAEMYISTEKDEIITNISTISELREIDESDDTPEAANLKLNVKTIRYNMMLLFYEEGHEILGYEFGLTIIVQILQNIESVTLNAHHSLYIADLLVEDLSYNATKNTPKTCFKHPDDLLIIQYGTYFTRRSYYRITMSGAGLAGILHNMVMPVNWLTDVFERMYSKSNIFPCFDEPGLSAKITVNMVCPKTHIPILSIMDVYKLNSTQEDTVLNAWTSTKWPISSFGFDVLTIDQYFYKTENERLIMSTVNRIQLFFMKYLNFSSPNHLITSIVNSKHTYGLNGAGIVTYREDTFSSLIDKFTFLTLNTVRNWFGYFITAKTLKDVIIIDGIAHYLSSIIRHHMCNESSSTSANFLITYVYESLRMGANGVGKDEFNLEVLKEFSKFYVLKSASVMRMLMNLTTENTFIEGLNHLLNKKSTNAAYDMYLNDFLSIIASNTLEYKSLFQRNVINKWLFSVTYPIVNVNLDYNKQRCSFEQIRFSNNYLKTSTNVIQPWTIPITYTTNHELNFTSEAVKFILTSKETIPIDITENSWIIVNVKQIGHYRVNYTQNNWINLQKYLNDLDSYRNIHVINRAQIIDDLLNFAIGNYIDYILPFNVVSYLRHETEYLPWKVALNSFYYIDRMLYATNVKNKYRNFITQLSNAFYLKHASGEWTLEEIQNNGKCDFVAQEQSMNTKLLAIEIACYFGRKHCITQCKNWIDKWMNVKFPERYNPIPMKLRQIVYCTIMQQTVDVKDRKSNKRQKFLIRQYQTARTSELFMGLYCSNNDSVVPLSKKFYNNFLLDYSMATINTARKIKGIFNFCKRRRHDCTIRNLRFIARNMLRSIARCTFTQEQKIEIDETATILGVSSSHFHQKLQNQIHENIVRVNKLKHDIQQWLRANNY